MLIADFFDAVFWEAIGKNFLNLCLAIDSIIYSIISWLYTIFIAIAEARIFTTDTIASFLDRLYLIIGIIALFFGAYIFLTIIINPDNVTKGNASPAKLIRNVVMGIISIVFVPTVFNFAYSVQGAVIEQNVIPRIFFDSHSTEYDEAVHNFNEFGVTVFQGSFYLKESESITEEERTMYENAKKSAVLHNDIKYFASGGVMDLVHQNKVQYNFFISGIIGIVLLFIFASYCINIAVRTVKLCFLQIMAPFPCLLLMIPGQEKAFKKWVTECLKTFFEVFAKIAVLVFSIFLIQKLQIFFDQNKDTLFKNFSVDVVNFAKLFLIIGICIFLKRAPKLLADITGLDLGNSGLSLKKTVNEFKESITPVTVPIDKVAGAAVGAYYANKARKIGEEVRGTKQNGFQNFMTTAGGIVNGLRGGTKKAGYAFDYEMSNQQWYSSDTYSTMDTKDRIIGGIDNRLRNNFGAPSLYKEKEAKLELEYNHKLEQIENRLSARKAAAEATIIKINNEHDPVIKRDDEYLSAIKDVEDYCGEKVAKQDSNVYAKHIMYVKKDNSGNWVTAYDDNWLNHYTIDTINKGLDDLEGLDPLMKQEVIAYNTKVQKRLASIYKDAGSSEADTFKGLTQDDINFFNEHFSGFTGFDKIKEKRDKDVGLQIKLDELANVFRQYQGKLGYEVGDAENNPSYKPLDASASLLALHDMIDLIKKQNAKGKKKEALINDKSKEYQYIDELGNLQKVVDERLIDTQSLIQDDEKKKKELSEEKAAQQMALKGYERMDRKQMYQAKSNNNKG